MSEIIISRSYDYLEHHGTKGQKWGVRRYQNPDGSLTAEGREHYGVSTKLNTQFRKEARKLAKLNERADVDKQTEKWHKYNRRAAKSMAVAGAGAALATGGTNALMKKMVGSHEKEMDEHLKNFQKMADYDYAAYKNNVSPRVLGSILGDPKDYAKRQYEQYTNNVDDYNNKLKNLNEAGQKKINTAFYITRHGGTAVAAAGLGFAVYNRIKASQAKKRVSEVGHTKAVAEAKAQLKKMEQMFANTPYEDFIKNMKKAV